MIGGRSWRCARWACPAISSSTATRLVAARNVISPAVLSECESECIIASMGSSAHGQPCPNSKQGIEPRGEIVAGRVHDSLFSPAIMPPLLQLLSTLPQKHSPHAKCTPSCPPPLQTMPPSRTLERSEHTTQL